MPINGNKYDWESVEIQGPQGTFVDVTEITYNDERPIEASYGRGSVAQGYGRKNYKAAGSLSILRTEYEAFRQACGGSVYTKEPIQIVVSYANGDQATVVDTLQGVHITKQDGSAKQGEEKIEMKLDFNILLPIKWGGVAAYNDGRDGAAGN
jgi:hypothetical protein